MAPLWQVSLFFFEKLRKDLMKLNFKLLNTSLKFISRSLQYKKSYQSGVWLIRPDENMLLLFRTTSLDFLQMAAFRRKLSFVSLMKFLLLVCLCCSEQKLKNSFKAITVIVWCKDLECNEVVRPKHHRA